MLKTESSHRGAIGAQLAQLQEEITILERRLEDMGMDGDCAYERAMSKVYTNLVAARKKQLNALRSPLFIQGDAE